MRQGGGHSAAVQEARQRCGRREGGPLRQGAAADAMRPAHAHVPDQVLGAPCGAQGLTEGRLCSSDILPPWIRSHGQGSSSSPVFQPAVFSDQSCGGVMWPCDKSHLDSGNYSAPHYPGAFPTYWSTRCSLLAGVQNAAAESLLTDVVLLSP